MQLQGEYYLLESWKNIIFFVIISMVIIELAKGYDLCINGYKLTCNQSWHATKVDMQPKLIAIHKIKFERSCCNARNLLVIRCRPATRLSPRY